jgi:hypothetical protein
MARSPYVHDRVDDDEMLQDGGRRLVPLMLKDAAGNDTGEVVQVERWQADAIWASRFKLDDGAALHKPGPRYCTDQAGLDAKAEAYADGVREMCDGWKNPPAESNSGSGEFRGARPGDKCTVNGAPGHLNHRLECMPDKHRDAVPRTMDAADAQRIKDEAYRQYCDELVNAWKAR